MGVARVRYAGVDPRSPVRRLALRSQGTRRCDPEEEGRGGVRWLGPQEDEGRIPQFIHHPEPDIPAEGGSLASARSRPLQGRALAGQEERGVQSKKNPGEGGARGGGGLSARSNPHSYDANYAAHTAPSLKRTFFFFLTACVLTVAVESPRPCACRGAASCLSSMHLLLPRTRKTSSGTAVCKNRGFSAVKILQTITRDLISRWI